MEVLMTDSICEDSSKLSVRGLVKRFDGKETLHNLTFDVREGEFLSILGPSGCGKTTTLRILIGLLEPDEGMILLDGRDITRAAPDDRGMGIVFQNYALFENMTVLGNVEYALKFKPELRGDRRAIATSVLEQIGLIDLMDRGVRDLSGGQQQRLCIARTLAVEPEVILMDEPTSALDPISTSKIEDLAMELKKDYTIVMVTHNMQQAVRVSDNTAFFLLGEVIEYNETEKLFSIPSDKRTEDYITGRFG